METDPNTYCLHFPVPYCVAEMKWYQRVGVRPTWCTYVTSPRCSVSFCRKQYVTVYHKTLSWVIRDTSWKFLLLCGLRMQRSVYTSFEFLSSHNIYHVCACALVCVLSYDVDRRLLWQTDRQTGTSVLLANSCCCNHAINLLRQKRRIKNIEWL